jgi:hypothetical protein
MVQLAQSWFFLSCAKGFVLDTNFTGLSRVVQSVQFTPRPPVHMARTGGLIQPVAIPA